MPDARLSASDAWEAAGAVLTGAALGQQRRLLTLHTPLGHDTLVAETLDGWERVDEGGFCLDVTALSLDTGLSLKSLLGAAVRLEWLTTDGSARHVHGHVTRFARIAANGGLARYGLRIEPWLAFLRWRQDSFVFQGLSVFEIVDQLLSDYRHAAPLAAAWRWDVADRARYPQRGITTQYQESDAAFLNRLLAEEGLYYWFEHAAPDDDDTASLGTHTLVIADHPQAFQPNRQASVAFQRADVTEPRDTVQQWQAVRQLQTAQLAQHSWDYKSTDVRAGGLASDHANALAGPELVWADDPGAYAWETDEQGQRLLAQALQALEVRNKRYEGESTVRTLAPGTTIVLQGHPRHDGDDEADRRFAVLAVRHQARNNLDETLSAAARELAVSMAPGQATDTATAPFYRNRFTAVRADIPYRPLTRDGHGVLIHPRPTVHGSHSAVVVGVPGAAVHTDRDHRIRIQFPWQRGSASASRAPHPAGDDNAPASEALGVWVRMASAIAGANWGQVALPRVGQEVLVEFLHGDIDRPVVVAALYNGAGATDAQFNQANAGAAGATGNAPAWFAGEADAHAHGGAYSGIKTQALGSSQEGTGGHNQLVFDDTADEPRLGLSTTQAGTRLHLGQLREQRDNARGDARGHGAELASQAQGTVRGGSGLLVSAHAQAAAAGAFLDSASAAGQHQQAHQLASQLAQTAQAQGVGIPDEPDVDALPAIGSLAAAGDILAGTQTLSVGSADGEGNTGAVLSTGDGQGEAAAYTEPQLQVSAPAGIGMVTPREAVFVSGATTGIVAGQDVNLASGGQLSIGVGHGVAMFAGGAPAPGDDPNDERGIRLHAARGDVRAQSQRGPTDIAADDTVTIASSTQDAVVESPRHVLLTAGGAYVRLEGSDIRIHAPGAVTFHAASHRFVGPRAATTSPSLPLPVLAGCVAQVANAAMTGAGLVPLGPAGGTGSPRQAATDESPPGWSVDDVLAELCPDDEAVVKQLAQTDVTLVDRIYYDDPYYDGKQWTTRRFEGGGQQSGDQIVVVGAGTPRSAATTLYHEARHGVQEPTMSWYDMEMDAYEATEQWTIDRGWNGQAGDDLRKVDAAGKVIPDRDAISDFIYEHYPIASPDSPDAVPGEPVPVVLGRDRDGNSVLDNGVVRAPREGDTYAGPPVMVNERVVPREQWKCPDDAAPGNKG